MKLAVSNILWSQQQDEEAFGLISAIGGKGVEVAPTRIAPWEELNEKKIINYKNYLSSFGLVVPAMQAIFYGCGSVALLESQDKFENMVRHLQKVSAYAARLGAGVLVFGAPKTRKKGLLSKGDAKNLAVERFSILADCASIEGVTVGLEAVTEGLGCDFITDTYQAGDLVRDVGHKGLRLHIDLGTVAAKHENPSELMKQYKDILVHVHFSRPSLGPIEPLKDVDKAIAKAFSSYKGWVSVEVLPQENALDVLKDSLKTTKGILIEAGG